MAKRYEVQHSKFDAARPFAVVATFRTFNKVVGRYETEEQAKRRARLLNAPSRTKCIPLERNPFYDNVQWVRS